MWVSILLYKKILFDLGCNHTCLDDQLFTEVKFTAEESHLTTRLALGAGVTTAWLTHYLLLLLLAVVEMGRRVLVLVCTLVARRTACRAVTVPAAIASWLS